MGNNSLNRLIEAKISCVTPDWFRKVKTCKSIAFSLYLPKEIPAPVRMEGSVSLTRFLNMPVCVTLDLQAEIARSTCWT